MLSPVFYFHSLLFYTCWPFTHQKRKERLKKRPLPPSCIVSSRPSSLSHRMLQVSFFQVKERKMLMKKKIISLTRMNPENIVKRPNTGGEKLPCIVPTLFAAFNFPPNLTASERRYHCFQQQLHSQWRQQQQEHIDIPRNVHL